MARDAPPETGYTGLYAWLLDRAEVEARNALPLPGNAARLVALRAGAPVDVPVGELPRWARGDEPVYWWRRVTVAPDGTVRFWTDDGAAWLAENELR